MRRKKEGAKLKERMLGGTTATQRLHSVIKVMLVILWSRHGDNFIFLKACSFAKQQPETNYKARGPDATDGATDGPPLSGGTAQKALLTAESMIASRPRGTTRRAKVSLTRLKPLEISGMDAESPRNIEQSSTPSAATTICHRASEVYRVWQSSSALTSQAITGPVNISVRNNDS